MVKELHNKWGLAFFFFLSLQINFAGSLAKPLVTIKGCSVLLANGINIRYYFGIHTSQNPACFPQQCEPMPQYCKKSIKCTQLGQPKFGALCNAATHHSSNLPTTSRQVLPSSPTWITCQFRLATPKDTKPYLHSAQTRAHHKRTHTHAHTSAWPQLAPSEATEKKKERGG